MTVQKMKEKCKQGEVKYILRNPTKDPYGVSEGILNRSDHLPK